MPRARANGIELEYDSLGRPGDPTLLLVMGFGAQLIHWYEGFCESLAAHRLRVVRFDNRDAGLSTQLDGVPTPDLAQVLKAVAAGETPAVPYTLSDMRPDVARRHRARGRGGAGPGHLPGAGQPGLPARRGGGARVRGASLRPRRPPRRQPRQLLAVAVTGSRLEQLACLRVPTLVIHGTADPIMSIEGGRATAAAIPGAQMLEIEGLGHDLPRELWPTIADAIAKHTERG
jgi:pimeloyl-ACP methyl ester carboxylesterase